MVITGMYNRSSLVLLLLILSLNLQSLFAQSVWEDPNDIFKIEASTCDVQCKALSTDLKECRDELNYIREMNQCRGPRVVKQPCVAEHYLRRFLSILLASVNLQNRKLGEEREIRVNFDLYFNSRTLSILESFTGGDTDEHSWFDLDSAYLTIFEGDPTFVPNTYNQRMDNKKTSDSPVPPPPTPGLLQESNLTVLYAIIGCFAFFIIYLTLIGQSFKSSLFMGAIIVASLSFGWTYYSEIEHLKMEALLDMMHSDSQGVPSYCLKPTGFFSRLWSSHDSESCLKFMKTKNVNPMVAVELSTVFKKTALVFFSWIPALSEAISEAVNSYFGDSVFGYIISAISRPFLLAVYIVCILLAFFIFFLLQMTFRFKTFFCELELGNGSSQTRTITTDVGPSNSTTPNLPVDNGPSRIAFIEAPRSNATRRATQKVYKRPKSYLSIFGKKKAASSLNLLTSAKTAEEDKIFRDIRRTMSLTTTGNTAST